MAARSLGAVLVGLASVLAGCSSPPPAPAPSVTLATQATDALPGAAVQFTWTVENAPSQPSHSELHYGPVSVADPEDRTYPSMAAAAIIDTGKYSASALAPQAPALYARAHVVLAGKSHWSPEKVVPLRFTGVQFVDVDVPSRSEAGVPFPITYHLQGEGASGHLGAHFSQASSAGLPEGFAAADWTPYASQHTAGALPLVVAVNATIPQPGTWHLRPHAIVNGTNHWGDDFVITVVDPAQPNIVVLSPVAAAVAGAPGPLSFQVNSQPGSSSHVGAHYSLNSSAALAPGFGAADWPGARASPHAGTQQPVSLPGPFRVNLTFPLPGRWSYRAHALVGGQNVWSAELTVEVAAPAERRVVITGAPTDVTVELNPLGANVPVVNVEWVVLTPVASNTTHTHVHHGPQAVGQPTESGASTYPAQTTPLAGPVPALFRANFTAPPTNGPYYFRAMAMLLDDNGREVAVWSDEAFVRVNVRGP